MREQAHRKNLRIIQRSRVYVLNAEQGIAALWIRIGRPRRKPLSRAVEETIRRDAVLDHLEDLFYILLPFALGARRRGPHHLESGVARLHRRGLIQLTGRELDQCTHPQNGRAG